ncbi:nucleotide sugar dehydrogenase [Xylaria nigripes]|nr:nucleotide sugar dehydrogenase [Xylaria nigripes]
MESTTSVIGDSRARGWKEAALKAPTTADDSSSFDSKLRLAVGWVDNTSADLQAPYRVIRNICYIGAGYVGGPTAAVTAYQNPNIRVTVVDKDEQRIRRWNSKHLPIYEPGLREIVRIARDGSSAVVLSNEAGRSGGDKHDVPIPSGDRGLAYSTEMIGVPAREPNLFFSADMGKCIGEADIVFIAVNTPTKLSGMGAGCATNMAPFEAAAFEIALYARAGTIIVEKSTVPCGTAQIVENMLADHRPGAHFEILSNPEFMAAGTAVQDLVYPDRVLIGSSQTHSGRRAAQVLIDVYASWVPQTRIITTNIWSSELSKLAANAMLAQRISSVNSISAICEKTGADIDEVAASIGRDPRIGSKFMKAGIGFGGSCFKKDILSLVYLADSLGLKEVSEYWRQVIKINEYQRDSFSRRVIHCLNNTLVGKKITIFGFTFKANTSDTRESLSLDIVKAFLDENPREIAIFDPCSNPAVIRREIRMLLRDQLSWSETGEPIVVYLDAYEACADSNAILITTECEEFRNKGSQSSLSPTRTSNEYVDPRSQHEITDMDKLSDRDFSNSSEALGSASGTGSLLGQYRDEPACAENCPECVFAKMNGGTAVRNEEKLRTKEQVDWPKIFDCMKKPKWLFDGKGVVDPTMMATLGFHVESVGRRGFRGLARY